MLRGFLILLAILVFASAGLLAWFTRGVEGPIPHDLDATNLQAVKTFIGKPQRPRPVDAVAAVDHPFLSPGGTNSMHNDSYQSDTYRWAGPLGHDTRVDSAWFHPVVGNCVSSVPDPQGRLLSTCVTPFGVTLVARDPDSLAVLAREKITFWLPTGSKFGGGVYFHQDYKGRVLLASNEPAIELWQLDGSDDDLNWSRVQSIPLGPALDAVRPEDHRVIDVMPDWQGHYWFITRTGLVGVADRDGSSVEVIALGGEGIDNALAVSPRGVFIASNHAMYRFNRSADGAPRVDWREVYDRGSAPKPGTMGHGTGTTPTLLGDAFVAITDNADGQINVVVYNQQPTPGQSPLFCRVPVFHPDRGTSENSLVAFGNSFIVENNFGYQGPYENIDAEPGLARVDIDRKANRCLLAWQNMEISGPSSVPKASLANGLMYIYGRDKSNPAGMHAWYFTAVNLHTGELAFKVLTGVGRKFNNHYGSISITPDGAAYIGTMGGSLKCGTRRSEKPAAQPALDEATPCDVS
jgi:hypothetical protein